jgi:glucose/arabinose dehydrogenase
VLTIAGVLVLSLSACSSEVPSGGGTPTTAPPSPSRPTSPASASPTPDSSSASQSIQPGVGPLSATQLTVAAGTRAGQARGRSLNLPAGWSGAVWAAVPGARMAAWAPDGRLVVSTGTRGVLAILTPTGEGAAPTVRTLLKGLGNPQGVAFTEQGGRTILVVGEETRLVAWDYADGAVTGRRVILGGLPGGGRHPGKFVAIRDGIVAYSVGSATNSDPVDRTATPERATIAQVGLDGTGNRTIATGVRNGEGLSFAPDGTLFSAVNQSDNQPYPFRDGTGQFGQTVPSYVNEHPNDQISRITPGTDLGWPYCVPDSRGHEDLLDLPYVDDPVNNPDGRALDCGGIGSTMLGLPAHSAPIGFVFTQGSALPTPLANGALITAHGSWNRQPPRAPYVAYSAWDDATATLGAPTELVTGFQNSDGTRWGRSVAAVPGPDGSIYVTDDAAGLVYRLTPGR